MDTRAPEEFRAIAEAVKPYRHVSLEGVPLAMYKHLVVAAELLVALSLDPGLLVGAVLLCAVMWLVITLGAGFALPLLCRYVMWRVYDLGQENRARKTLLPPSPEPLGYRDSPSSVRLLASRVLASSPRENLELLPGML